MDSRTSGITTLVWHHSAGHEANTAAIRQEHLDRGFGDIGYQGVIERNGTVGAGRDLQWAGAQDLGVHPRSGVSYNQCGYGLCSIGNFMDQEYMTETQYQSLLDESEKVCRRFKIPIIEAIRHKDGYATDCPGDNFPYTRLKSELGARLAGPASSPVISTTTGNYTLKVITSSLPLNVRSGPGTGYAVIRTVAKGSIIQAVAKEGDWWTLTDGGYGSGTYLQNITPAPVVVPIPAPIPAPITPTPTPVKINKYPLAITRDNSLQAAARLYLAKGNSTAVDYVDWYIEAGSSLNIDWLFLFAQSIKETGFWKFGGQVDVSQNNFGGLGATNVVDGQPVAHGASFSTPGQGIMAQGQHVWGYMHATGVPAGQIFDPRFDVLASAGKRGSVTYASDFNGRWAYPGTTYGDDIVGIMDSIVSLASTIPVVAPDVQPSVKSALDIEVENVVRPMLDDSMAKIGQQLAALSTRLSNTESDIGLLGKGVDGCATKAQINVFTKTLIDALNSTYGGNA